MADKKTDQQLKRVLFKQGKVYSIDSEDHYMVLKVDRRGIYVLVLEGHYKGGVGYRIMRVVPKRHKLIRSGTEINRLLDSLVEL